VKTYLKGLAAKMAPYGFEPQKLVQSIWAGTEAMVKNDGTKTNEAVFWEVFKGIYGETVQADYEAVFEEFYRVDFQKYASVCGYNPMAAELVHRLKNEGKRVVLATNPLFPAVATRNRIGWAGLKPEDFEWITTYENINYCKPNLAYYKTILERLGLKAEDCLMVGNDVGDDMVVPKLGMKAFLLTDCLLNYANEEYSHFPQGGFPELVEYLKMLEAE